MSTWRGPSILPRMAPLGTRMVIVFIAGYTFSVLKVFNLCDAINPLQCRIYTPVVLQPFLKFDLSNEKYATEASVFHGLSLNTVRRIMEVLCRLNLNVL